MDDVIEEELVYGALRRERQWKKIAGICAAFGAVACLTTAALAILSVPTPPVVVAIDAETGLALPEAHVRARTLLERPAVIESNIYRYVLDRETYNQLDNDARIMRVLAQSAGNAAASLRQLWTSGHDNYPPTFYGPQAQMDVEILSITLISNNRAQIRLRKRLSSNRGDSTGLFTATMLFEFNPEAARSIDDVWRNPFGFTVREYAIRSDRLE
ncbi:VirB8 protein [Pseudogemmobacter humi]|uniref:VirB8 protein n=2 Tax=Pseudogemmobacter humi TaxID=2483812 RepID=A0A3P5XT60_9RHOB|nr:VirB8 protein [Pseudogemmobacter humi]